MSQSRPFMVSFVEEAVYGLKMVVMKQFHRTLFFVSDLAINNSDEIDSEIHWKIWIIRWYA